MSEQTLHDKMQVIETTFVAQCRDWSLAVGAWTVKAAALKAQREELDKQMSSFVGSATIMLMKAGHTLPAAEGNVERLMEKAFSR